MTDSPTTPAEKPRVTGDMRVLEIVTLFPHAGDIMAAYGLHCFSCAVGGVETLTEGCRIHGFDDTTIAELLDDINAAIAEGPQRAPLLTITPAAARAVHGIAEAEGRAGEGLRVIVDASGGFCMEFTPEPAPEDQTFSCPEESAVRVFASLMTLQRIGGATIDFREGRFKLDLPEEGKCGCMDSCKCV